MAGGRQQDPFILYRDHVPVGARERLAKDIESIDFKDYDSVAHGFKKLLAAIARGEMPPAIAKEIRETMQTTLITCAARDAGTPRLEQGTSVLINVLAQIQQSAQVPLVPTYVTPERVNRGGYKIIDAIEMVDPLDEPIR